MKLKPLLEDLAVSAVAGYAGTKAMEPVSMKLYEVESQADRDREDAVRPGPPYEIAARKIAKLLGVTLEGKGLDQASLTAHYALALSWSPVYMLLRRATSLGPLSAGLVTGAAMSAVADEWMTPALGFSAPNRAYPLSTHMRAWQRTWCSAWESRQPPRPCGPPAAAGPDRPARPHRPHERSVKWTRMRGSTIRVGRRVA